MFVLCTRTYCAQICNLVNCIFTVEMKYTKFIGNNDKRWLFITDTDKYEENNIITKWKKREKKKKEEKPYFFRSEYQQFSCLKGYTALTRTNCP